MYYWLLLAYPSHIASSDDVGQQDALVLILGGGGYDAEDDKPQPRGSRADSQWSRPWPTGVDDNTGKYENR